VNQDSIRILPRKIDHLFETAEDVFAGVIITDCHNRVHEFNDRRGALGQINAHHPLIFIVVISVADKCNSNLVNICE
jgi:hypothetical protein